MINTSLDLVPQYIPTKMLFFMFFFKIKVESVRRVMKRSE